MTPRRARGWTCCIAGSPLRLFLRLRSAFRLAPVAILQLEFVLLCDSGSTSCNKTLMHFLFLGLLRVTLLCRCKYFKSLDSACAFFSPPFADAVVGSGLCCGVFLGNYSAKLFALALKDWHPHHRLFSTIQRLRPVTEPARHESNLSFASFFFFSFLLLFGKRVP